MAAVCGCKSLHPVPRAGFSASKWQVGSASSRFRQDDNPARWRGHLENLLANPNKIAPVKNHPALPWREVPAFMVKLAKCEGVAARAAEFAILTAARSGEVRGATWEDVDLWRSCGPSLRSG
jgi:integrase